jgi:glycosyltransferase involved in cell wall biosynthesis
MRILQVITSLRTGGAERLVTDLSKGFRAAGDSVEVLLFDGTRTPLVVELESAGIPVHSLGTDPAAMHNPLLLFRLNRFLRRHHYDVIHAHNTPCQLLLAVASLGSSLPLFTTEHNTSNRRRKLLCLRPLDRWMYGRYRRIVCVGGETEVALADYLKRPVLADRLVVIPNGIDIVKYSQASPATDIIGTEGCRIAMVAAFRPQKDQQTLIRAMALLPPDFQLYLAGGYETESDKAPFDDSRSLSTEPGMKYAIHLFVIRDKIPP